MAFLIEYLLFLAKAGTIVAAIILLLLFLVSLRSTAAGGNSGRIEFKNLSERYKEIKESFLELQNGEEKEKEKTEQPKGEKKWWEFWKKEQKTAPEKKEQPNLYLLNFDGDMAAAGVKNLREEVSALLQIAEEGDEVLLNLKSPGGVVNGYGLAASQLVRIREKGLHLTVAVDEVAASGGYLMACVANKIIAAPFAIVGSVGVVAQLPNFHKLLEKFNIDYEQFTAGDYKRTVTMFGENTDEGREKFKSEIEEIHTIFKEFVHQYRPDLDIEMIATGEHWLAVRAKELGLVDELKTSDAYLLDSLKERNVFSIKYIEKKSVRKGLSRFLTKLANRLNIHY